MMGGYHNDMNTRRQYPWRLDVCAIQTIWDTIWASISISWHLNAIAWERRWVQVVRGVESTDIELDVDMRMYFHDSLIDLLFFLLHISHALCTLRFLRSRAEKVSPSLCSSSLNGIELNSGALPDGVGCLIKYVSRRSPVAGRNQGHLLAILRVNSPIHFKQILITGQIYWRFTTISTATGPCLPPCIL